MEMTRTGLAQAVLAALLAVPAAAQQLGEATRVLDLPGFGSMGAAFDGEALWVADRRENTLFRINPVDGKVLARLPTPGYRPTGLTWDGEHLWIADRDQNQLFRLHPQTGLVDRVFRAPARSPRGLAWDGEYLYLGDAKRDVIFCVDPIDGTTVRRIPTPSSAITGLTYDGRYLWAADRNHDEIYRLEPEQGRVIGVIASPGPHPWGLAWDGEAAWSVDYQTGKLYRLVVKPDDPVVHLEEKRLSVEYVIHFMTQGPDDLLSADFYIAVPEDRYHQGLLGQPVFSPEPNEILTDRFGQRVARFRRDRLKPGLHLEASMAVDVVLNRTRFWIEPERVLPLNTIPPDIRKAYLSDGRKYRLRDPVVIEAVRRAIGDETHPYWMARRIYQFVLDKLDYRLSGGWDPAPLLLERGTGSCSEYSFVLIALCRAAGIPARYVGGIVTRGDDAFVDNVFHRWVEVYLPGYGWIPVDPDRGDRKTPRGQALGFGYLDNRVVVTTVSGGESEYLDWKYNGNVSYTFRGRARVYVEHIGELAPVIKPEPRRKGK